MIFFFFFSLPGKQLFEKDHNLDTSDIQFLEDGNNAFSSHFFTLFLFIYLFLLYLTFPPCPQPLVAGNSVEVDESLFQEIEDLELDQDDPDFDPLNMDSDED